MHEIIDDYWHIWKYETINQRGSMEDTHIILYPFLKKEKGLFVGIFDGHNGNACANFIATEMENQFNLLFNLGDSLSDKMATIRLIFDTVDRNWLETAEKSNIQAGSTAICMLIIDDDIFVANTGDSRAIMCRNGGDVIPLSVDHVPEVEEEKERIIQSGGTILGNRLQGILEVSRSFGDLDFKKSNCGLICTPEITHHKLTSDVDYLVIGCDGLYHNLDNNDIAMELYKKNKDNTNNKNLRTIAEKGTYLVNEAIDRGTTDNITAIIVKPIEKKVRSKKLKIIPKIFNREKNLTEDTENIKVKSNKQSPIIMSSESNSPPEIPFLRRSNSSFAILNLSKTGSKEARSSSKSDHSKTSKSFIDKKKRRASKNKRGQTKSPKKELSGDEKKHEQLLPQKAKSDTTRRSRAYSLFEVEHINTKSEDKNVKSNIILQNNDYNDKREKSKLKTIEPTTLKLKQKVELYYEQPIIPLSEKPSINLREAHRNIKIKQQIDLPIISDIIITPDVIPPAKRRESTRKSGKNPRNHKRKKSAHDSLRRSRSLSNIHQKDSDKQSREQRISPILPKNKQPSQNIPNFIDFSNSIPFLTQL